MDAVCLKCKECLSDYTLHDVIYLTIRPVCVSGESLLLLPILTQVRLCRCACEQSPRNKLRT